jgi:hypothetical protein
MIARKLYTTRRDGVKLYITYSDSGMKIEQSPTGILYDSAVDVENAPYTYTETNEPVDEPIDSEYIEPNISAQDALNAIFGGAE